MKAGDINLIDPDLVVRCGGPPHEYFEVLRRESPVHWNPESPSYVGKMAQIRDGFWILTKHADVFHASKTPAIFSSWQGGPVIWDAEGAELEFGRAGMMGMDPPDHNRFRRLVQGPFAPANVGVLETMVRQFATEIVDGVASQGQCDLMEVASLLPVMTMCHLMGIPAEDRKKIYSWSNAAVDMEGNFGDPAESRMQLYVYASELAAKKRQTPDGSMLSTYANAEIDGERLTELELNQFFLTLSIAGHETTRNTTLHFIRLMIENPEQYELLRSDLGKYLPGAMDEVLRLSPPVMQFRRTLTEDVEMRGSQMKKGDKVYLAYASANRDEEVFSDPHRFDITRANAGKHLSFGAGQHFCLGAAFARMQLRTILRELVTRLPDIRMTQPPTFLPSIWFNALVTMPVRFTPAPSAV